MKHLQFGEDFSQKLLGNIQEKTGFGLNSYSVIISHIVQVMDKSKNENYGSHLLILGAFCLGDTLNGMRE